ncbi:MAG: D-alanyl-D-alanine carboxypeptidase [Clostridia bacterium]|nr:D-alanyl-D-alanine carboxypeptidase [Clostridia bacterium]
MKKHRYLPIIAILLILGMLLPVMGAEAPESSDLPESEDAPLTQEKPEKEPTEADLTAADTVLLYCIDTDTVLREKNADGKVFPATAVKLMTALLAYEQIADLKAEITVTSQMLKGVSGSFYGFSAGDTVTGEDLIKLLLLRKSNDAALILAHTAAGSVEAFVASMNEKAKELGMTDTFFVNPTGLHDNAMTTTAKDLLKLSMAFYSCNQLHEWSGAGYLSFPGMGGKTIYNNNYFLSRYYNGTGEDYLYSDVVDGLINGGTAQSGDVLLTSATYKGLHYIAIVLGGKKVNELPACYTITKQLIQKDTQNFHYLKVLRNAEVVCELPVKFGDGVDYAAVFAKETLEYYLPKSLNLDQIEKKVELSTRSLIAPVHEGDRVGKISVYLNGTLLGETDLVVQSNITRSGAEYRITQAAKFLQSEKFLKIASVVVLVGVVYVLAHSLYLGQKKKRYQNYQRNQRNQRNKK